MANRAEQRMSVRITQALAGHRRDLNRGFGAALNNAVELSVTPAIFAFLGWRVDLWLGTSPVFFVGLFVIVFSCVSWRMLAQYDLEMRDHERRFRPHAGSDNR